jgi:hypothetical protein
VYYCTVTAPPEGENTQRESSKNVRSEKRRIQ